MQKTFDYKDATISYELTGNGLPVIVLLHGFGEDSTVWSNQIAFLQNQYTLVVPDLPGTGGSYFKDTKNADSIEHYADLIADLLKHENIKNCIMLGHSMGGYITLAFAEKYSSILQGFGLIHSTAFADNEEKKITRQKGIAMMEEYGGYAFLKNTTPNLFSARYKIQHPEKVEELIEKGKAFSVQSLQDYYKAMMNRPDRTSALIESNVPVLFIMGTDDVAAPIQDVLQQTHLPNTSFINIREETGHMGMWENTDKVNEAILEFVNYASIDE